MQTDERRFHNLQVTAFRIDIRAHLARRRADKSVTCQNSEKRSDQSGADGSTDDRRSLIKNTHGMNDTQDRGDDPETRKRFRDRVDRMLSRVLFFVHGFNILIEKIVDIILRKIG